MTKTKKKIAFLDRDGTINVEKNYLYRIEDFEFMPGVIEGLKKLQDNGFLLVIVTNQSGIGRGYYTVRDMEILHRWIEKQLHEKEIDVKAIYYCPHLPNAVVDEFRCNCNCRKPKTGMYKRALEELGSKFELSISDSIAIGDKMRDLSICEELKIDGVLITSEISEQMAFDGYTIMKKHSFYDAVEWVINRQPTS